MFAAIEQSYTITTRHSDENPAERSRIDYLTRRDQTKARSTMAEAILECGNEFATRITGLQMENLNGVRSRHVMFAKCANIPHD